MYPGVLDSDAFHDGCSVCGEALAWVTCWQCLGSTGFHYCGLGECECEMPEINQVCEECGGLGRYRDCPGGPHRIEEISDGFN